MNCVAPCLLLFLSATFFLADSPAQVFGDQTNHTSDFYDTYTDYSDDFPITGKGIVRKENAPETVPSSRLSNVGVKAIFVDMVNNILVWRVVLTISVFLLLILLATRTVSAPAKTFRIESGGKQQSGILMGVQTISENASLYYVHVGAQVLVIGVTAQQISLVETLPFSEFLQRRPCVQALNSAAKKEMEYSTASASMNLELAKLRKDILELQRSIDELRNQVS